MEQVFDSTPKMIDDSINNIVNNLSLLNKFQHKYSINDSGSQSLKLSNHRLTKNLLSPLLQKSPLCSTPFKVKYRGESIFKFSPIVSTHKDSSAKHESVVENSDDSNSSVILLSEPKLDNPKVERNKKNSKSEPNIDEEVNSEIIPPQKEIHIEIDGSLEIHQPSKIVADDTNTISTVELSSLQTTEIEPLLGFPVDGNNEIEAKNENHVISIPHIDDNFDGSNIIETEHSANKSNLEERLNNNSNNCNISEIEHTENHSYDDISNKIDVNNDIGDIGNDNSIQHSTEEDENSLYDTCASEQSSIDDDETSEDKKEPVVLLQKMNDSLFFKYYEKMNCVEENSDDISTINKTDFKDCNNSKVFSNSTNSESELDENGVEDKTDGYNDGIESNDDTDDESEEDKSISFVTTRRRNEVTNNSMMTIFNESNCSSSTDCDITVLGSKGIEKPDDNSYIDNDKLPVNLEDNANETLQPNKDSEHLDENEFEQAGISFVTTRNSNITDRRSTIRGKQSSINPRSSRECYRHSDLYRENLSRESDMSRLSSIETKPSIVLQPGKRWERCLSIYRRMTMMTDHFDKSILEDESTSFKGRKYRQSVISTMEMQEFNSK